MTTTALSRRTFLRGVAAGAAVLGFDPITRHWVTAAHADAGPFDAAPPLDGTLVTDPAALAAAGADVGGLVFTTPRAVLRPGSVQDIQTMIRFCRERGIHVAARGQGHTVFGQSQVDAGLSIDMTTLNQVHAITDDTLVVDAGAVWRDVLAQTTSQNLVPPVLTSYQGLSVGGTLSVGGISGLAYDKGAQIDHVLELQVVDGRGELITCSPSEHPGLFNAVLGGLGQCALIVRATIRLVPVGPLARYDILTYVDQASFFADLKTLVARGEVDSVFGMLHFDFGRTDPAQARWTYELHVTTFYTPPDAPDDTRVLRGLTFQSMVALDLPTYVFHTLVDGGIASLRAAGFWDQVAHPWFDVFVPGSEIERYTTEVLPTLDPVVDLGFFGFFLVFPIQTRFLRRPLLRVPHEPLVFLFDILTSANAPGVDPAYNAAMLERNRRLFERARELGGSKYNIAAIPFSEDDWRQQLGGAYFPFAHAKQIHDPGGILTPGPGIF